MILGIAILLIILFHILKGRKALQFGGGQISPPPASTPNILHFYLTPGLGDILIGLSSCYEYAKKKGISTIYIHDNYPNMYKGSFIADFFSDLVFDTTFKLISTPITQEVPFYRKIIGTINGKSIELPLLYPGRNDKISEYQAAFIRNIAFKKDIIEKINPNIAKFIGIHIRTMHSEWNRTYNRTKVLEAVANIVSQHPPDSKYYVCTDNGKCKRDIANYLGDRAIIEVPINELMKSDLPMHRRWSNTRQEIIYQFVEMISLARVKILYAIDFIMDNRIPRTSGFIYYARCLIPDRIKLVTPT